MRRAPLLVLTAVALTGCTPSVFTLATSDPHGWIACASLDAARNGSLDDDTRFSAILFTAPEEAVKSTTQAIRDAASRSEVQSPGLPEFTVDDDALEAACENAGVNIRPVELDE